MSGEICVEFIVYIYIWDYSIKNLTFKDCILLHSKRDTVNLDSWSYIYITVEDTFAEVFIEEKEDLEKWCKRIQCFAY